MKYWLNINENNDQTCVAEEVSGEEVIKTLQEIRAGNTPDFTTRFCCIDENGLVLFDENRENT